MESLRDGGEHGQAGAEVRTTVGGRRLLAALAVATLPLVSACSTSAAGTDPPAAPATSPATGFYSLEQAERGRQAFREACGECHSVSEFRGSDFEWRWRRQTVWDFYRSVTRTMPENDPGNLSDRTVADVIAYILLINDYVFGVSDLLPTEKAMEIIPLGPGTDKTGNRGGRVR
jgi:mono/diheme cytochrome c family protein